MTHAPHTDFAAGVRCPRVRVLPQLAGVVVLALAGAALAGAALGLEALEAPIRPATAAAVIALGLALLVGGRLGRGLAALAGAGGVVGLALERMGPHSGVAI